MSSGEGFHVPLILSSISIVTALISSGVFSINSRPNLVKILIVSGPPKSSAKISENDKYSVLLHSDLFILLSHTEAQPITVIEAGIFRCGIILSSIEMLKKYKKYKTVLIYSKRKIDEDSILNILNKNEFFLETQKSFINLHSYTLYKKKILKLI